MVPQQYPRKLQLELERLADDLAVEGKTPEFYRWFNHDEMVLLKAALTSLGFKALSCGPASLERPEWRGIGGTPFISIEAKQEWKLRSKGDNAWWADRDSPERNKLIDKIRGLNMKVKAQMLDLLDEFYHEHASPSESVHLILMQADWLGSFRLQCQGVDIARIPQNRAKYPKWVNATQAEMRAFAEFCVRKIDRL